MCGLVQQFKEYFNFPRSGGFRENPSFWRISIRVLELRKVEKKIHSFWNFLKLISSFDEIFIQRTFILSEYCLAFEKKLSVLVKFLENC